MADARRPPDLGQHRLGPHVVGQRVVVRRLVRGETGPTGGPAFTDLLGVCTAWGDGACVVQPESGDAVTIAIADIVSGKPVPARTSARLRVSTREAEGRTGALWPGVERVALGEWELRHEPVPAGRPLKRANSCLAVGDPGVPLADAVASVEAFYTERQRPALVQVEAGSSVEESLRRVGWSPLPRGESEMQLASLAQVRRALGRQRHTAELAVSGSHAVASVGDGCDPLAEGRAGVHDDWIGLHGITVDPAHRRRGLATAVVAELLEWGAEVGALTAWLHVERDNPGALAFWESLGFVAHHTCRYYAPPGSPWLDPSGPASAVSASPVSR